MKISKSVEEALALILDRDEAAEFSITDKAFDQLVNTLTAAEEREDAAFADAAVAAPAAPASASSSSSSSSSALACLPAAQPIVVDDSGPAAVVPDSALGDILRALQLVDCSWGDHVFRYADESSPLVQQVEIEMETKLIPINLLISDKIC